MKLEVNITKSSVFTVLAAVLLFAGLFFSYAYNYNQPIPNPGHGADTVWINATGVEETLQDAVSKGHILTSLPIDEQLCTFHTTFDSGQKVAWIGWISINLSINGRNICEDNNGCTYRVWARKIITGNVLNYEDFYTSYPVVFRQSGGGPGSSHVWLDAFATSGPGNKGYNGDGVAQALYTSWYGSSLYDDQVPANGETNPDRFSFQDNSATYSFDIVICDY